ncbi:MAG TPA: YetF domain-containing protein [Jatrophihabitantaceae bacterium]|nr:YetF domain-containing protein [Jatrophihabitantaceae bacterium]
MWHDMFAQEIPFDEKLIRTVAIYALVAVLLRATGKRGLSGLNSLDVVVMFLLSNVVQNAIIGPDNSITGGIIGAVTLVVVNSVVNRAALRSDRFSRIFDGRDTPVIVNGRVDERAVRRLGLRRHDLDHAVRLQNGDDLRQVESGVFDPGGQLILSLKESAQGATKRDVEELRAQLNRIEQLLGR